MEKGVKSVCENDEIKETRGGKRKVRYEDVTTDTDKGKESG